MPIFEAVVMCRFKNRKGRECTEKRTLLFEHEGTAMEAMAAARALADSTASCEMEWLGFETLHCHPVKFPLEKIGGQLINPRSI